MLLLLASLARATDHPHAIVTGSIGVPDLLAGRVEVFVSDRWSIEAGAGIGLLPLTVHAGARWSALWPEGWDGHHLRVAPGAVAYVFPSQPEEGMAVLDCDVAWGVGSEGVKLEPAIEVIPAQVGVIF